METRTATHNSRDNSRDMQFKIKLSGFMFVFFCFAGIYFVYCIVCDSSDWIRVLRYAGFLLILLYMFSVVYFHKIIVTNRHDAVFVWFWVKKRYRLDEIKGFSRKRGFVLHNNKRVRPFYPRLRYHPHQEFKEWISTAFTTLDD